MLASAIAVANRYPQFIAGAFAGSRGDIVSVGYSPVAVCKDEILQPGPRHNVMLPKRLLSHTRNDGRRHLGAGRDNDAAPLWPAFLEEAFAKTMGQRNRRGYDVLCRGWDPRYPLAWLTGCATETRYIVNGMRRGKNLRALLHDIETLFLQGECVIVSNDVHAYALVDVRHENGAPVLLLMDPREARAGRRKYWRISSTRGAEAMRTVTFTQGAESMLAAEKPSHEPQGECHVSA